MIEDNGDPNNPSGDAYVDDLLGGGLREAAVEAWENEGGRPESHDSLYRAKLVALARIVDEKIKEKDSAQAAWTIAKAALDAAYEDLHKAAGNEEQYLPFGHPGEAGCVVPSTPTNLPASAAAEDFSWRAVSLHEALPGLSKGIHDSFSKNDPVLQCMGDLSDWCKDNRLIDIPGIGEGKGQKIEDALMEFWENRNNGSCHTDPVAAESLGPEPTPEDEPLARTVALDETPWKAEGEAATLPDFGTAEVTITNVVNEAALVAAD